MFAFIFIFGLRQMTLHNHHLPGGSFFWKAGPVGVLLCHGYTATTAEVRLLARRLHEQGYTVAGPLLPGHGATPQVMNRCRWQDWAAGLESAYQELAADCEQVFVGGESMGALLAIYVGSQHPKVAGLLTYCPALRIPRRSAFLARLLWRVVPQVNKKNIATLNQNWQGYPVNPVPALIQLMRLQREIDRRLPRLEPPLLVVQGRHDTDIDLRGVELLYKRAGSKTKALRWMEHSAHLVLLEDELEQVVELTVDFMEQVREKGGVKRDA